MKNKTKRALAIALLMVTCILIGNIIPEITITINEKGIAFFNGMLFTIGWLMIENRFGSK